MAKSFGLAGLRLGWLACKRRDTLEKVLSFKDYLSICNNAAGEALSSIALRHKEKFITPNIAKIVKNQQLFGDFARKNSDLIGFHAPKAGSTALIELKTRLSAYEYSEKLVSETGIMLLPSEMFDYGSRHARIGFGRENLPEVLSVLQDYINRTPQLAKHK